MEGDPDRRVARRRAGRHRVGRAPEPVYLREAVDHLVAQLEDDEWWWEGYLRRAGATPLSIRYEEFSADYAGTLASVLDFIGVAPPPQGFGAPPLERQADERSEAWYREHTAA